MQYWEVYFADGTVVSSHDSAPEDLPNKRVLVVLQPGARERTGWKDRLLTTNFVLFRTDLDCWTEHDPDPMWAVLEFVDHAHVISCCRLGKWQGDYMAVRAQAEARYKELVNG